MAELPRVSLVVAIRNERDYIEQCLSALAAQSFPAERLEVIVVDGMSDDGTRDILRERLTERPGWRLLDNPGRSLIPGLNAGISAASGDFIGYVNGHTELPIRYVERMLELLQETGAWSVGGAYDRVGETPAQRALALVTSSPFGVGDSRHNYGSAPGPVETVFPGFWPRWVFDRVGLFDPGMTSNEDNELSYRIRQSGGTIWFDPSVQIRYHPRRTFGGAFGQFLAYGEGKVAVFARHHGAIRWRHLVPPAWVGWLGIGGMASLAQPAVRLPYIAGMSAYATVIGLEALRIGGLRAGDFARLVAAFATVHFAYGVGVWTGLLRMALSGFARR